MSLIIDVPPTPPAPPKRADGEVLFWQRCDAFVQYIYDLGLYLATYVAQVAAVSAEMLGYRDSAIDSAALATTQAGLATTNGAAQVALAANQATLATTNGAAQVALATAQVALATTQAGLSLQYAQQAQVEVPDAWDAGTTYTFPQVVAGSDGNTYRCAGTGIVGVNPTSGSASWVRLTGGLASGADINLADYKVQRPYLQDWAEVVNARGSISGAQTIDLELGNVVTATITAATTFTFSNPPTTGRAGGFVLVLTNGGAGTITWPTAAKWAAGTAPTLTASGTDIISFISKDAGTLWYGIVSGKDVK